MSQHLRALARAQAIRAERAQWKRALKTGRASIAVVLDPSAPAPVSLRTMPIDAQLASQPGWRERRARRLLGELEIRENRPVGELTERQRRAILDRLPAPSKEVKPINLPSPSYV